MILVVDTGPLIALSCVDLLSVLPRLAKKIYLPYAVALEATGDLTKPGARMIRKAIDDGILHISLAAKTNTLETLSLLLGAGEAEALALASQMQAVAVIDDRQARNIAAKNGVKITGTAALLVQMKQSKQINQVDPYLQKLSAVGYRLPPSLCKQIRAQCGE